MTLLQESVLERSSNLYLISLLDITSPSLHTITLTKREHMEVLYQHRNLKPSVVLVAISLYTFISGALKCQVLTSITQSLWAVFWHIVRPFSLLLMATNLPISFARYLANDYNLLSIIRDKLRHKLIIFVLRE